MTLLEIRAEVIKNLSKTGLLKHKKIKKFKRNLKINSEIVEFTLIRLKEKGIDPVHSYKLLEDPEECAQIIKLWELLFYSEFLKPIKTKNNRDDSSNPYNMPF